MMSSFELILINVLCSGLWWSQFTFTCGVLIVTVLTLNGWVFCSILILEAPNLTADVNWVCYYLNDVFLFFFVQSRFYKVAVNETVLWFQVGSNRSHFISLLFHVNPLINIRFCCFWLGQGA